MKRALSLGIFLITCLVLSAQEECTYEVGYSYNRNVSLVGLHFVGEYTLLALEVDGGKSGFPIFLHPRETPRALELITWQDTFPLLDAKGIAFYPLMTNVMPGEKKRFLLYFERLPDEVTAFNLIEPGVPLESGFNFDEVRLMRRKSPEASCRFFRTEDFRAYFSKAEKHADEGFWLLNREWGRNKGSGSPSPDTVALVWEDGLLRVYDLKGIYQQLEWSPEKGIRLRFGFQHLPFRKIERKEKAIRVENYQIKGRFRRELEIKEKTLDVFLKKLE